MSRDYYFYKAKKSYNFDKLTSVERDKWWWGKRVVMQEFPMPVSIIRIQAAFKLDKD